MLLIFKRNVTNDSSAELTLNMMHIGKKGQVLFNNCTMTVPRIMRHRLPPYLREGGGVGTICKKKSKVLELEQGFKQLKHNVLYNLKSKVKGVQRSLFSKEDLLYLENNKNPYFLNLTEEVDTQIVSLSKAISFEISISAEKVISKFSKIQIEPLEDKTTKVVDELFSTLTDSLGHFSGHLYSETIWAIRHSRHHLQYNVVKQPCCFTPKEQKMIGKL
jgi:hypothetical protein